MHVAIFDNRVLDQCNSHIKVCSHKKRGRIYVGLSHIHLIQILKILTLKISITLSTYDCQLYNFVLFKAWIQRIQLNDDRDIDVKSLWLCM